MEKAPGARRSGVSSQEISHLGDVAYQNCTVLHSDAIGLVFEVQRTIAEGGNVETVVSQSRLCRGSNIAVRSSHGGAYVMKRSQERPVDRRDRRLPRLARIAAAVPDRRRSIAPTRWTCPVGHRPCSSRGSTPRRGDRCGRRRGPSASAYSAASLAKQKKYARGRGPARAALEANPLHERRRGGAREVARRAAEVRRGDRGDVGRHQAQARVPRTPTFWRGQAYYGKKKADRMVEDFETFLKLAPKSPEAPIVRQLLSSLG